MEIRWIQIFKVKECQNKIHYKCLPLIMLDSVIRVNKKCYPQAVLEECKCEIKKILCKILSMMV